MAVGLTEERWRSGTDVRELYDAVRTTRRCSRRVTYLVGAALCRRIAAHYPDPVCLEAVELVERIADGEARAGELPAMVRRIETAAARLPTRSYRGRWAGEAAVEVVPTEAVVALRWLTHDRRAPHEVLHAQEDVCGLAALVRARKMPRYLPYEAIPNFWTHPVFEKARAAEGRVSVHLLRDVIGNPFRRVRLKSAWRAPPAVALARAAYDQRELPSGVLDVPRLAVLADALEEAGCTDAELLGHLRGPGPHVRGCWAVDLVLGKA
jgi:hypothetical protein